MTTKRRKCPQKFKVKVALEAVKGMRVLSELCSMCTVRPMVNAHRKQMQVKGAAGVFGTGKGGGAKSAEEIPATLYERIGCL